MIGSDDMVDGIELSSYDSIQQSFKNLNQTTEMNLWE